MYDWLQDHKALVTAARGTKALRFLRFDGCSVSTLGAYRLLKICPHNKVQCWRDGEQFDNLHFSLL